MLDTQSQLLNRYRFPSSTVPESASLRGFPGMGKAKLPLGCGTCRSRLDQALGKHRRSALLTSTEGERAHICPRGISLGKPTLLLHVRYLGHSFSHMPRNSDLTRIQSLNFLRLLSQSATNTVAYGKRNIFSCSSGKIRNQAQQSGPGGPGEDPSSALPISGGGQQTLSSCSGHLTPISASVATLPLLFSE